MTLDTDLPVCVAITFRLGYEHWRPLLNPAMNASPSPYLGVWPDLTDEARYLFAMEELEQVDKAFGLAFAAKLREWMQTAPELDGIPTTKTSRWLQFSRNLRFECSLCKVEWYNTPDRDLEVPAEAIARAAIASLDVAALKRGVYERVMAAYARGNGSQYESEIHSNPYRGANLQTVAPQW